MNRKIVISSNTAWSLHNFRSGLITALIEQGFQVVAVAPEDDYSARLKALGCRFIGLPMDNHGTHPGRDLLLLMRYVRLLRSEQPSVYLGYTVKPNVYGSFAAHLLRIPAINNIAGLGTTFVEDNFLTRIVRSLYKGGLYWSARVFFQNREDQQLFVQTGLVRPGVADRVPGSGIDLTRYLPNPSPSLAERDFRFLLVARMLRSKGIVEYVEAARIVRRRFPHTRFQLLGFVDERSAHAISLAEINAWESADLIDYCGKTDDVMPYMAAADCIVLPSFYREGVPRTLLEAAAMARPIITTDSIGCRDAVDDGVNGFLCKVKSADDLAEKMIKMIELSVEQRTAMGQAGRRKIASEFDEKIVIQKYLEAIEDILNDKKSGDKNDTPFLPVAASESEIRGAAAAPGVPGKIERHRKSN